MAGAALLYLSQYPDSAARVAEVLVANASKYKISDTRSAPNRLLYVGFLDGDGHPQAEFEDECMRLSCTFDALKSSDDHGVAEYIWTVGDSTIGPLTVPTLSHTFDAGGTYTVQLTVADTVGQSDPDEARQTDTRVRQIEVAGTPPPSLVASFDWSCGARHTCDFWSTSTGPAEIETYLWSFADTTRADSSFTHGFPGPDTWDVKLKVTDTGMRSDSVTQTVVVPPDSMPVPVLSVECLGLLCTFDGSESRDDHGITWYEWYINGEELLLSQTASVVEHEFPSLGEAGYSEYGYSVSLWVRDGERDEYEVWSGHRERAGWYGQVSDTLIAVLDVECPEVGLDCVFDGSRSRPPGEVASYEWSVDGVRVDSTTVDSLAHTFSAAGTYTVGLTVADTAGVTDDTTQVVTVTAPMVSGPEADFAYACGAGLSCELWSTSTGGDGGTLSYSWLLLPDSTSLSSDSSFTYSFASADTFHVALAVSNAMGQTADTTKAVVVPPDNAPVPSFSSECGAAHTCELWSTSTDDHGILGYSWLLLPDSTSLSSDSSFTHDFGSAGTHEVALSVTDGFPHTAAVTGSVAVPADSVPEVALAVSCDSLACVFDGSASRDDHGITGYTWYVGADSVGSTTVDTLAYTFSEAGTYAVRLAVADGAGQTADSTRSVTVPGDGPPTARFAAACEGWECVFDGSASTDGVGIETYAWTVNGGSVGTGPVDTLAHTFTADGTYEVTLVVSDSASQTDDTTKVVTVRDSVPEAALTVSCDSLACVFDGSGSRDDIGIETYAWSVDGDSVGTVTADTLAHTFSSAGTYSVALRVEDQAEQSDTETQQVEVPPPSMRPNLRVGSPAVSDTTPAAGASFTLSATVTNAGDGASGSTTLRYFRSADATIGTSDTAAGTGAVGGLAAAGTSAESISVTAPSTAGTYYYGACVDAVTSESNTADNCSTSVRVDVEAPPNLRVRAPSVSDATPATGATFTLSATVANAGDGASGPTTLRYYRSEDATISRTDTAEGTGAVVALAAAGTSAESISVTAPSTAGRYYYGACVDAVTGESNTADNCSTSVRVDVEAPPNLQVGAPAVSDTTPATGATFTLSATVANAGDGASGPTTLRYYRSADATISRTDTAEGTGAVDGLAAAGTSAESISVRAPSTAGRYYYGACVDAVTGESNTADNCSTSVRVDVDGPPTAILDVSCTGLDCTFDGSDSTDDDRITNYIWEVDGTEVASGTASSVNHTFTGNGTTYTVTLTVEDSAVPAQTDSDSEPVTPRDNRPVADFDYSCDENRKCDFDGTESTDDVGITDYSWSVEEGIRSAATGTGSTFEHTFDYGTSYVTLTVTDKLDQTGSKLDSVTFAEPDSVPVARLSVSCDELECTFDGSNSTDDNGIESYTWEVDGTQVATGAARSVDYTFGGAGTYSVTLTVADSAAQTDSDSESVTVVSDEDPSAIISVSCTGLACTFDGSNSTDDNGITTFAWEVDGASIGSGSSTSHTFGANGTYSLTLTVTDTKGQTDSVSENLTVRDDPPTASFTYSCTGLTCTFDASGSSDDVGIAGYTWSFLEGPRSPDTTPTRTHMFSSAGSWQVTLNVQDTAGQTGSTSLTIDVSSM